MNTNTEREFGRARLLPSRIVNHEMDVKIEPRMDANEHEYGARIW
jgi:hypothetical protein